MQKILIMTSDSMSLRSTATGWTYQDSCEVLKTANEFREKYSYHNLPVGLVRDGSKDSSYCYPTPLHALGQGWKLLAPPAMFEETYDGVSRKEWEWWFTKD